MSQATPAADSPAPTQGSLRAAMASVMGTRPGVRFLGGAIAGAWVGFAAALIAGPWGPEQWWHEVRVTGPHPGQILVFSLLGGILVGVATWIPHRTLRCAVLGSAGGFLLHHMVLGRTAPCLFAAGLAGVGWTLESAVSRPWFAHGRARGLLAVLAAVTVAAALTAARGLPEQLPNDAGAYWLVPVLCCSTALSCLSHAAQDALAVRLIARVGDGFEERDEPEGAVKAVATRGEKGGRVYLGRLQVRQGRGAYRSGETGVPIVQLLAKPAIARRWLAASALGLGLTAALLLALAAQTGAALAGREGAMRRFLVDPPAASAELPTPPLDSRGGGRLALARP